MLLAPPSPSLKAARPQGLVSSRGWSRWLGGGSGAPLRPRGVRLEILRCTGWAWGRPPPSGLRDGGGGGERGSLLLLRLDLGSGHPQGGLGVRRTEPAALPRAPQFTHRPGTGGLEGPGGGRGSPEKAALLFSLRSLPKLEWVSLMVCELYQ